MGTRKRWLIGGLGLVGFGMMWASYATGARAWSDLGAAVALGAIAWGVCEASR